MVFFPFITYAMKYVFFGISSKTNQGNRIVEDLTINVKPFLPLLCNILNSYLCGNEINY